MKHTNGNKPRTRPRNREYKSRKAELIQCRYQWLDGRCLNCGITKEELKQMKREHRINGGQDK